MAYIVNTTITPHQASGLSYLVNLGEHVTDDLLHVIITQVGAATPISFHNEVVTVTNATDLFTYSGSSYWTNGDQITISGTAPTGTTAESVRYYIRDLDTTAKTFKLETSPGAGAINITSDGVSVRINLMTTGANHPLGSGWRMLGIQARVNSTTRHVHAYKTTTSAAETAPTFYGTNDDWTATTNVVRDADPTAPFGSETSGTDWARVGYSSAATSTASPSLTTAVDGCLLVYTTGLDMPGGIGIVMNKLNDVTGASRFVNASICQTVAYRQQAGDGTGAGAAAPSVTTYRNGASRSGDYWVVAIRNKSGGAVQPDVRPSITDFYWYGGFGNTYDPAVTWGTCADGFGDGTAAGSTINGIHCSDTAPTSSLTSATGDPKYNWNTARQLDSTENVAAIESPAGTGAWVGGYHTLTSTNMSGKVFAVTISRSPNSFDSQVGAEGTIVVFGDGTNWEAYQVHTRDGSWSSLPETAFIACGGGTPYASSGTLDWTAITRVGYFVHRNAGTAATGSLLIKNSMLFSATAITGGGASRPATFSDYAKAMVSWGGLAWADIQGAAQVLGKSSVQIGDGGTNLTYFDSSASSFEFPLEWSAADQIKWNSLANKVTLSVKAGASDTINLAAGVVATDTQQALTIDNATSTSAAYSFAGTSFVGWLPTWKTGVNVASATFKQCAEIDAKGSDWTDCSISKTTSTDAAFAFTENGGSMTRCTIDVTGTSALYHLELGASVTAVSLTDVTFTGTPGTDKVHVKATTGTVTITIDGTTSLVAGDVTSDGATVSIVAPTFERGLEFTGLVAGSQVKVFTTGTTTELFTTSSSGTTETFDDATVGSITVDYTIMKAGYIPIRVTGVVLTGAVGTGVITTPIQQVIDRAYSASSGLTFTTNCTITPGTKIVTWSVATTGQNLYSFAIEAWIAQASLKNVEFPFKANGPNSFTLDNGWETRGFTTAGTGIANTSLNLLSRDGLRYLDTSHVRTASWAALLSVGTTAGMQVRYQQTDGGTTVDALATGNIDQLIQIYGDASHGNFDYTGYLVCKVQEAGYDQVEVNVVTQYGTLEDQLYVIALAPTANGIATGDPALTITITDHGASPVTWNGKVFSITIVDNATPSSGTDILRELRYNFDAGGTYQGKDGFNWHDLVQTNGSDFKTVRGIIYGDTGATLKGVRVVQNDGTSAHPDFTLFTADDGTTYAPPTTVVITLTGFVSGTRIQIYDTANSVELFNDIVAATSKVYTETYSVDRTIRVRASYVNGTSAKAFVDVNLGSVTSSAPTVSRDLEQVDDSVYNLNAVNGSLVTGITFTDSAVDVVNINIAGGSTTWQDIYAAFAYWMFTSTGIADDIAYVNAVDTANYQLTSMIIKNTSSPTAPLEITGGYGVDSTTLASIDLVDTTGGTLIFAPDHVVPYSAGAAATIAIVQSGLSAQGYSTTRAVNLDNALTEDNFLALK